MSEVIRPQPGPQEAFLSSPADIVFFGGAAGGGKSYALLLEPLRHITTVRGFGAVIFRRTTPQIRNEGGLWDSSIELYRRFNATPRESFLDWQFAPYKNTIKFAHMEHEDNRFDWQGAQVPLIMFDELTHFTRKQFFYMLSRNRSTCGVRPYMRGVYNPVPPDDPVGGWIHEFVGWYIDDSGYPIPEKSGIIRWFVNRNDNLHWFDSKEAAAAAFPDIAPMTFTYILSTVYDNKILLEKDPGYLARLMALDAIEEERLLKANHKIRPEAGKVFNRAWFEVVQAVPAGLAGVRFWDLAATEKKQSKKDPDFTASCLMVQSGGIYYILDATAEQVGPADTDGLIMNRASQDGRGVAIRWEEEGGASGKRDSAHMKRMLAGYDCDGVRPQGDKLARSRAFAAQGKAGNVKLLAGDWNERWLRHMHAIPDGAHDDEHDAAAGAFNSLLDFRQKRPVSSSGRIVKRGDLNLG